MKQGETIETKSITDFRYFEVTVEVVSMMSLGLFDETQFEVESEVHLGWRKGMIGYHADHGCIFLDGITIVEAKPYGDIGPTRKFWYIKKNRTTLIY